MKKLLLLFIISTISINILSQRRIVDYNVRINMYPFSENSAQSEIPTFLTNDTLYIFKNKSAFKRGSKYYDLFKVNMKEEYPKSKIVEVKGEMNSKFNDGPMYIDTFTNKAYLTRNSYSKGDLKEDKSIENNILKILIYDFKNGAFTYEKEFKYNDSSYSVAHATVSPLTKRIYFASNMPGGYGGIDLYYCDINDTGSFSPPVNLGRRINTSGNEMFPYVKNGVLFYSSNGTKTLGGLDIFFVKEQGIGNELPKHFNGTMNSKWDDFAMVFKDDRSGYFASNRNTEFQFDDNIYYFTMSEPIISDEKFNLLLSIDNEEIKKELLALDSMYLAQDSIAIENGDTSTPEQKVLIVKDENDNEKLAYVTDNGIYIEDAEDGQNYSLSFADTLELADEEVGPFFKDSMVGEVADIKFEPQKVGVLVKVDKAQLELLSQIGGITNQNGEVVNYEFKKGGIFMRNVSSADSLTISLDDPDYDDILLAIEETPKKKVVKTSIEFKKIDLTKLSMKERIDMLHKPDSKRESINIALNINFALGSYKIRYESYEKLDSVVYFMKSFSDLSVQIEAHTDSRGNDESNMKLSKKRAKSCFNYLIKNGVEESRMGSEGFGESKLLNDCGNGVECDDELHEKNRRVEFVFTTH